MLPRGEVGGGPGEMRPGAHVALFRPWAAACISSVRAGAHVLRRATWAAWCISSVRAGAHVVLRATWAAGCIVVVAHASMLTRVA